MGIETPKHGCLARSSEFAFELKHLFPWAQLPPLSSVPLVKRLKTLRGKKAPARAVGSTARATWYGTVQPIQGKQTLISTGSSSILDPLGFSCQKQGPFFLQWLQELVWRGDSAWMRHHRGVSRWEDFGAWAWKGASGLSCPAKIYPLKMALYSGFSH